MIKTLLAGLLGINDHMNTQSRIQKNKTESQQRIAQWNEYNRQLDELHKKIEDISFLDSSENIPKISDTDSDFKYGSSTQTEVTSFSNKVPKLLEAKLLATGTVQLRWEQIEDSIRYDVYCSTENETEHKVGSTDGKSTSYTDKTLFEVSTYTYRIRAVCKQNSKKQYSAYSNPVTCLITEEFILKKPDIPSLQKTPVEKYVSKPTIDIDNMDGHSFEKFCADILKKNGFRDVVVTQGSGDQGVDILAKMGGVKYGFQCKHYSSPVGNKAVQEVYSGKNFYNCHVGVVITNSTFTSSAIELAEKNGILLWNRRKLTQMIEKAYSLEQD